MMRRKSELVTDRYRFVFPKQANRLQLFEKLIEEHLLTSIRSDLDNAYFNFRRDVIARYIKRKEPNVPWEFRAQRGMKDMLDLEIALWESIEIVANELFLLGKWNLGSAATLYILIEENEFVMLSFPKQNANTFPEFLKLYQNQNKKLIDTDATSENPFTDKFTRAFIDTCLSQANGEKGDFRSKYYLKMIRARQAYTAWLKDSKSRCYTKSGINQKGRKVKNLCVA